jgi:hypothetical protein
MKIFVVTSSTPAGNYFVDEQAFEDFYEANKLSEKLDSLYKEQFQKSGEPYDFRTFKVIELELKPKGFVT